jgi:hypothetical protein
MCKAKKANIQRERRGPSSPGATSLNQSPMWLRGALFIVWISFPFDSQFNQICNIQPHLSIIQGPIGMERCPKACPIIRRCNALHQGHNVLREVKNVLGIMIKMSSKGPCQVHHGQTKFTKLGKTNNHEIQESLES